MHSNQEFIFGIRAVIEAIKAGKEIDKVVIQQGLKGELFHELYSIVKEDRIPFQFVPQERINKISRKNHQGIIAYVSPVNFSKTEDIVPFLYENGKIPLFIVLDRVTDVRNFGAICRTAECAGVDAVIFGKKNSAQINADAIKTSAGAIHNIDICREQSVVKTVEFLKESGITIFAATEKAGDYYFKADFSVPAAIIMGAEDKGISRELLALSDFQVKIPILGKVDSLNVSVAASVVIYEAVRQRLEK